MHPAFVIAIPASVGCAGALLVARGLIGRRVQTEPRCRRCDYELTELMSLRCPECGTVLHPDRVRTTRRIRRVKPIILGIFLGVAAASIAWFRVPQQIERLIITGDWRGYVPVSIVIHYAEKGDEPFQREMLRRIRNDAIPAERVRPVAARALDCQHHRERYSNAQWWIDILGELQMRDRLCPADLRTFQTGLAKPIFETRRSIGAGDRLPIRISIECAAPQADAYVWAYAPVSLEIDGAALSTDIQRESKRLRGVRRVTAHESALELPPMPMGQHVVSHEFELRLYRSPPADPFVDDGIALLRYRLESRFEIESSPAANEIVPVRSRALRKTLCNSFSARVEPHAKSLQPKPLLQELTITLERQLPCDVAFEVFLSNHEHRIPVGKLVATRHHPAPANFIMKPVAFPSESRFEFAAILTTSSVLAAESVDVSTIWDGTLTYIADGTAHCVVDVRAEQGDLPYSSPDGKRSSSATP